MQDRSAIKTVNQHPLNRAAKKFLPPELQDNGHLHALALVRWGLDNELEIRPSSPSQPDQEQVLQRLKLLESQPPNQALNYLLQVDGEPVLSASELEEQPSPQAAAALLLETLHSNMVSQAT